MLFLKFMRTLNLLRKQQVPFHLVSCKIEMTVQMSYLVRLMCLLKIFEQQYMVLKMMHSISEYIEKVKLLTKVYLSLGTSEFITKFLLEAASLFIFHLLHILMVVNQECAFEIFFISSRDSFSLVNFLKQLRKHRVGKQPKRQKLSNQHLNFSIFLFDLGVMVHDMVSKCISISIFQFSDTRITCYTFICIVFKSLVLQDYILEFKAGLISENQGRMPERCLLAAICSLPLSGCDVIVCFLYILLTFTL